MPLRSPEAARCGCELKPLLLASLFLIETYEDLAVYHGGGGGLLVYLEHSCMASRSVRMFFSVNLTGCGGANLVRTY